MQNRLHKLLDSEQLTPAKFAEILGVQRSAISHILTGRNNPSYDLISKIILKFPALNSDWLITGKGNMYKTLVQGSLFDFDTPKKDEISDKVTPIKTAEKKIVTDLMDLNERKNKCETPIKPAEQTLVTDVKNTIEIPKNNPDTSVKKLESASRMVKRIVVFYTDNTFEEFISTP